MILRQPIAPPPQEVSQAHGFSKTFQVELITPLYGGGVQAGVPDTEMPIRASAIRGQLRFWWRILNPEATFQQEKEIWGGMSETGATASHIGIAVKNLSQINKIPCAQYPRRPDGGWRTMPDFAHGQASGYALFPGQGKAHGQQGVTEKPHDILKHGLKFSLDVEVRRQELWNDILPVLRWWSCFGGLGARTRRGLGSIKVTGEGITPVSQAEALDKGCRLVPRAETTDAISAWTNAIAKLKEFRQGVGVGRNSGAAPNRPGRSRWPEADSIRQITACSLPAHRTPTVPAAAIPSFPRAAFGMPIITHFKDAPRGDRPDPNLDPVDTSLQPVVNGEVQDRMASPLILKAMWMGKNYRPIALLLPHDFSNMALDLAGNRVAAGSWWSTAAQTTMTGGRNNPLQGRSGNVLQDFLAFFQEN